MISGLHGHSVLMYGMFWCDSTIHMSFATRASETVIISRDKGYNLLLHGAINPEQGLHYGYKERYITHKVVHVLN